MSEPAVAPEASPLVQTRFRSLLPGDHVPWFKADEGTEREFPLHHLGGRYVVVCFLGRANHPAGRDAIEAIKANQELFDGVFASFCGISFDTGDEGLERRLSLSHRAIHFLIDRDFSIGRLWGALPIDAVAGGQYPYRGMWMVLDPTLRMMKLFPIRPQESRAQDVIQYLKGLPPPLAFLGFQIQAPILVLPNVFETELCKRLIALHEEDGGRDTGVMKIVDGNTKHVTIKGKKRADYAIQDPGLRRLTHGFIARRVLPEILKAYQSRMTRIQRYTIGCYSAEDGGHFGAHRDNTTPLTAHRRFAVSVVLNDDYEGGAVSFPEYGPRAFKPPAGCAIVFSCSLLHAVSRVTSGKRYVFLPFLFDEIGMQVYLKNHPPEKRELSGISHVPNVPHPGGGILFGES